MSLDKSIFLSLIVVVVVVSGFYVPPTAKVIRRRGLGLKSHPEDFFDGKIESWDKSKLTFLALQHLEYQNTICIVVMLDCKYLPIALVIYNHKNNCKNHSLKILLFHK